MVDVANGWAGANGGTGASLSEICLAMEPPHDLPYAKDRYRREVARLYGVLDRQLADNEFVAGDFLSVADIAIWPWARLWDGQQQTLDDKPHMARWLAALGQRPAFIAGLAVKAEARADLQSDRAAQDLLFRR